MVLSQLPEYSFFPTTVRHHTRSVCPRKVAICWCVSVSHTRMVLSQLPEYSLFPTTVKQYTQPVCPCKVVICWCVSLSHTRMVLSSLPEYSFFPTTVRHVTQLVCPRKVFICIPDGGPRSSLKCSLKKHGSAPQSWFLNTLIKQSTNVYFLSIHSLYSALHSTPPLFIVFLLSVGCLQDVDYDMNSNTLHCTLLHSTGIHSSPLRNECIN